MSVQNRKKALLGFGALAVVLIVAVIVTWPPAYFEKGEATGAIGAVEKHRETQITPQDVVLGDEATREAQKVAYLDYFNDAAKLQNIAANLAVKAQAKSSVEAKRSVDVAARQLQSIAADLRVRYAGNTDAAIAAMQQLLARDSQGISAQQVESINTELADLSVKAKNREQLDSAKMLALSAALANVAAQVDAAGHRAAVAVKSLENVRAQLARAVAALQAANCCSNKTMAEAASQIENAAQTLENRSRRDMAFSEWAEYLGVLALESQNLDNVQNALAAVSRIGNQSEIASQIENVSSDLVAHANHLEVQALENLKAQLEVRSAYAAMIQNLEDMVAIANRSATNRASLVENRSAERFNKSVENVSANLNSVARDFRAQAVANIRSELAVIDVQLNSRRANHASLLAAQSALAAKLADVQAIESHLASLSRALAAKSALGAQIAIRSQLEAQASDLRNRASAL